MEREKEGDLNYDKERERDSGRTHTRVDWVDRGRVSSLGTGSSSGSGSTSIVVLKMGIGMAERGLL